MQVLLDQTIDTDYGQFDLNWGDDYGFDGEYERFFGGQINGLAGAASGRGVYLNLARRSGGSAVRIELHDDAPNLDEEWEDVVEVSTLVPAHATPSWSTWAGEDHGPLSLPPGEYRVRVSARGRDVGADPEGEFAEGLIDFYLVELWPATPQPDAIIKSSSANALYWHREVGSRR